MYPTLFISHGAPNIILGNSKSKKSIEKLGKKLPIPKYIIIVSAHYVTRSLKVINPSVNKIMYDFYGFEDELYKVQYEIKSEEFATFDIVEKLKAQNIDISIDESRQSYDHGVWNVLSMLYKNLQIPVIQLSLPISYSVEELVNLGEKLKQFKNEAMIICSGGITHNLGGISYSSDVKKYANNRIDNVANLYGPGKAAEYAGKQGWKPIEPGDVCWEDMDGNDVIDSYDRYVVGNIFPNITGGFSTTFSYKNWSLYGRFDYALGHTLYNDLKARTLGQYQGTWNIITDVKDMWTEDNPNTDLSKYYFGDQNIKKNITRSNNGLTAADNNNSHYYEKGDYLCLRELTLSYTLPKSLISKCFMTDASVYVTGQNLFYITGYEGTSPEPAVSTEYGRGIDNGRYPTPRTVLFGLSVSF